MPNLGAVSNIGNSVLCLLGLGLFGVLWWTNRQRTYWRAIPADQPKIEDEEMAHEEMRQARSEYRRKWIIGYLIFAVVVYLMVLLSAPVQKVKAALWGTNTPTIMSTKRPTITPTASPTPWLTPTPYSTPYLFSSPTGLYDPFMIPTNTTASPTPRTVIQYLSQYINVTVVVYQTVMVTVIVSDTSIPSETPLPTSTSTITLTPISTSTFTQSPTSTLSMTSTPSPTESQTLEPTETQTLTPDPTQ